MKNKNLCIIIIFFSCLILMGNFTILNAYTTENYNIDIPQNFKRTEDKISGTIYKKDDEKDFSIGSIQKIETVDEYLEKLPEDVKIEVVEINEYKAFFSQTIDNEGIYNGGYVIFTDNYQTFITVHSKTDIANDKEIKKIISSLEIKDTTTRNKNRVRKIQDRKNNNKNEVMAFFIINSNTNKYNNYYFNKKK